jgi:D-alanine-D-alanine ligase
MRIGITYDLKTEGSSTEVPAGRFPDDWQEEFDSPATIEAIAAALRELGHEVDLLGDGRELLERLLADPSDLVFNLAEGLGVSRSREARVPAVLEMLGIPYTGSDPLTLAVTLDKDCAKRLVQAAGVAVARGFVVENRGSRIEDRRSNLQDGRINGKIHGDSSIDPRSSILHPQSSFDPQSSILDSQWSFPLIVKPAWEGSSKGIRNNCLVTRFEDLDSAIGMLQQDHGQPVLVEEFIDGDELTVGILGNDPPEILGVMRVLPSEPTPRFIYSLEVKRDFLRQVRYECPARIAPAHVQAVEHAALTVYRALGCRDVARIDFRMRCGIPYFLEVNPLPGLNPETSDLVILARLCGWSYEKLIETILLAALQRMHRFTPGAYANVRS